MTLVSPARLPQQGSSPPLLPQQKRQAYAPLRLFPHDPSARAERVKSLMLSARKGFDASSVINTAYRQPPAQQTGPAFKRALKSAVKKKDWRKAVLFNQANKGLSHLRAATDDLSETAINLVCSRAAKGGDWERHKLMNAARKESSASWALSAPLPPDYTEKELEAACFEAVRNENWQFILELLNKDLLTNRTIIKLIDAAERKKIKGVKKPLMNHLLPKNASKILREDVLMESIEAGCPLTAQYALEQGELSYEALENGVLACCGNQNVEEIELETILASILRKSEGFLFTKARSKALISAAEGGRTALIHLLLGEEPHEREMRRREAVYAAKEDENIFICAFFNPSEKQHAILRSLINWCRKKKGGNEYPFRLLASTKILKCAIEKSSDLKLSGLGLTSLPNCLPLLEKLESLDLSGNSLRQLPECLACLSPDCVVFCN